MSRPVNLPSIFPIHSWMIESLVSWGWLITISFFFLILQRGDEWKKTQSFVFQNVSPAEPMDKKRMKVIDYDNISSSFHLQSTTLKLKATAFSLHWLCLHHTVDVLMLQWLHNQKPRLKVIRGFIMLMLCAVVQYECLMSGLHAVRKQEPFFFLLLEERQSNASLKECYK